jgi:pyruvate,water dikinase
MSIAEGHPRLDRAKTFPSPLEVTLPTECQGWEELYPPHVLFAEDRRGFEEGRFWFQDAVHYAEPYYPFDAMLVEYLTVNFSRASGRRFVVPTSVGAEHRIVGGYVYLSPNSITDEVVIAARAELFAARAGDYYEHWEELDRRWREKVQTEIRALEALEVPELPEVEGDALVTEGGFGPSHRLLVAYDRLLESFDRFCQQHFDLMNLGYGAYLAFHELCREAFPDISEMTVAKMVAGIDVVALRPDDELKRLAARAVELGLGEQVRDAHDEAELTSVLAGEAAGEQWLAEYQETKDPWFYFSYGNGLYHHHRSWIDDPRLPIAMIESYVERVQAGENIHRRQAEVRAERDRVTGEYRALLADQTRHVFDQQLALARTVFPHIEDHNFYIDHWAHTLLWTRCASSGVSYPVTRSSATPKMCSSCATTRSAWRSRSCACIGAQAAPGSRGDRPTGGPSLSAARRSTRRCVDGLHPGPWVRHQRL